MSSGARRGAVVAAALLLLLCLQMGRTFRASAGEFHRPRLPLGVPPGDLRGAGSVEFPSRDGSIIRGWWVPSAYGATVLLLHGSESDRRELLPEARLLLDQGFGVLLFDWPGTGESGGRVTWGPAERAALLGAVDWLERQAPAERLGALGFSMGATILVPAAAEEPRLRALLLEGVVLDLLEQTDHEYGRWGPLSRIPARLAKLVSGYDPGFPKPLEAVARLEGRPLLLLAGTADRTVPPSNSQRLFAAAHAPKELWMVEGAGHGRYLETAGEKYRRRLVGFFQRWLIVSP